MATTCSPTFTASESPRGRTVRSPTSRGSTFSSATSLESSTPITLASTCVVDDPFPLNVTVTPSRFMPCSLTTWALVRM